MTAAGRSSSSVKYSVSQADWCLAATIAAPFGMFSVPRRSTSMPATTRAIATSVRDQNRDTFWTARRPNRNDGRPNTPTSRVKP